MISLVKTSYCSDTRTLLVLLMVVWESCVHAQEMVISPHGDTHILAEDESFVLKCEVVNAQTQDAYLKWYDPAMEEIIESNGRIYVEIVDDYTRKLYFTQVQDIDAGIYTCEGVVEGNTHRKAVTLQIFKDITFDYAPASQNPVEFTDGLIHCQVSGSPAPEISWRYRGDTIDTGGRYIVDVDYGLRVRNITQEDNGLYECRAEVPETGKMDKRDITVEVHRSPTITKPLGVTSGVEHQQVAMECKAEGLPDPTYEFYKINEGGGLSRISSTETRFVDELAGVVHYDPISRDDQGDYLCIGMNSAGEAQTEGYLDVIVPPKIYQYFNLTQVVDNPITLICLSEGEPSPNMTFRNVKRDYDYKEGANEDGRVIVRNPESGRLELTIEKLVIEDTANYTCKSHNNGGFVEQNGTIVVEHSPEFPEQETEFYGWPGKTRNITCHTIAEPAPAFEWWHNNKKLETNETFRIVENLIKDSVLQIYMREEDRLWVYGEYDCLARNQHGENSKTFTFMEATKPDAPKDAWVVEESPTMVILEVEAPDDDGGLPIIGYRVEFYGIHDDFLIYEEIRIENLQPETTYQFNVRARNEIDVGLPFSFSHQMLDVTVPMQIVIISEQEGYYPYEYTLLWEKPLSGGIPIKEYRFKYRRVRVVGGGSYEIIEVLDDWLVRYKEDDPDYPMSSYRLEGLKSDTYYQVEVEARNDIGWSDINDEFVFHTFKGYSVPIGGGSSRLSNNFILVYCALSVTCYFVYNMR